MGIVAWIILGLVAGLMARAISPNPEPGGLIMTTIVGIVGAIVGGLLGGELFGMGLTGLSLQSLILAVVGSTVLLWLYRITRGSNRTTV